MKMPEPNAVCFGERQKGIMSARQTLLQKWKDHGGEFQPFAGMHGHHAHKVAASGQGGRFLAA